MPYLNPERLREVMMRVVVIERRPYRMSTIRVEAECFDCRLKNALTVVTPGTEDVHDVRRSVPYAEPATYMH